MGLPFRLLGNKIQVYRFQAMYQQPGIDNNSTQQQVEIQELFVTKAEADLTGGVVTELDVSDTLWLDGIILGSSENLMTEALSIYQAGKEAWWTKQVDAKCVELSDACHATIVSGCDVALEDGSTEHFSLAETDQINLTTALAAVEHGATGYPYHADGQMCQVFSAADIQAIAQAATVHKLYYTTLCNHLMAWARRVETKEELAAITYQAQLPEDLAKHMEEVMAGASAL